MESKAANPRTLQLLARYAIRRCLARYTIGCSILHNINKLVLPKKMKEFVGAQCESLENFNNECK